MIVHVSGCMGGELKPLLSCMRLIHQSRIKRVIEPPLKRLRPERLRNVGKVIHARLEQELVFLGLRLDVRIPCVRHASHLAEDRLLRGLSSSSG